MKTNEPRLIPTQKQGIHSNGRLVSVRLDDENFARLGALAVKAQRSRGVYIKLALRAVLPNLERQHWDQVAAEFEENAIIRTFHEIMEQIVNSSAGPGNQS